MIGVATSGLEVSSSAQTFTGLGGKGSYDYASHAGFSVYRSPSNEEGAGQFFGPPHNAAVQPTVFSSDNSDSFSSGKSSGTHDWAMPVEPAPAATPLENLARARAIRYGAGVNPSGFKKALAEGAEEVEEQAAAAVKQRQVEALEQAFYGNEKKAAVTQSEPAESNSYFEQENESAKKTLGELSSQAKQILTSMFTQDFNHAQNLVKNYYDDLTGGISSGTLFAINT